MPNMPKSEDETQRRHRLVMVAGAYAHLEGAASLANRALQDVLGVLPAEHPAIVAASQLATESKRVQRLMEEALKRCP